MKTKKMVLWMKTAVIACLMMAFLSTTAFAYEQIQLGETERAWWSEATVARWKKVDHA